MAILVKTKSLSYKDVNLLAQIGEVESRKTIPIEGYRIVISAMTSIIGPTFIKAIAKIPLEYQPTLHIPRDIKKEENLQLCKELNLKNIFIGVGLIEDFPYERAALNLDYKVAFLDIANGYLPQIKKRVMELKNKGFTTVICGSVHTQEGYKYLQRCDVDIIRSGIAPGSVCITKDSTGFTRGTITELFELFEAKQKSNFPDSNNAILADGGIKSPSDCNKAFFAGADYIMSGRLFVQANECRMHQEEFERNMNNLGILPKHTYFGMASELGKISMGNKSNGNIEGTKDFIQPTQSLQEIIITIWDGIKSGVSYSGYSTLTDAIGNGVFEIVT